eukprot:TRINITY_DN75686_c0_g1_i1.p1 TRINITY_DN75686_c0_g1~~TRINITY_DN75686_c0_g1_i1.p1  ORF type:complete len:272 (+),score=40.18 TRINITY_DN75686_c0_g1_i1:70-885(+)
MECAETLWRVAGYLAIRDVARLQLIASEAKKTFHVDGARNVWRDCAGFEFEDLYTSEELFEGPERCAFLRFLLLLGRANYASYSPLVVSNIDQALLMDGHLRKAADVCSAHLESSGREAHMLLGEFDVLQSARSTMFAFGTEGKAPIAGLPGGFLRLKLVLDGNALWVWADYGSEDIEEEWTPYRQAGDASFTLSVASAESNILMTYRGVPLVLDGCWRSTMAGVSSQRISACRRNCGLTMCVVSLLDGLPPSDDVTLMNAMNLDAGLRSM